jgi:hypothetical protein
LLKRKEALRLLLEDVQNDPRIRYVEHFEAAGPELFRETCRFRLSRCRVETEGQQVQLSAVGGRTDPPVGRVKNPLWPPLPPEAGQGGFRLLFKLFGKLAPIKSKDPLSIAY